MRGASIIYSSWCWSDGEARDVPRWRWTRGELPFQTAIPCGCCGAAPLAVARARRGRLDLCRCLRDLVGPPCRWWSSAWTHDLAAAAAGARALSANPVAGDGRPDHLQYPHQCRAAQRSPIPPRSACIPRRSRGRAPSVAHLSTPLGRCLPCCPGSATAPGRCDPHACRPPPCPGARGPYAAWRLDLRATKGEEDEEMEAWVIVVCLLVVVLALYNTTMTDTRRR